MFCNYCGAPNPDDAKYCNKCGHAVVRPPAPQQPNIPNVESLPPDDQPTQKSVGDIGNEFSDTYSNMLDDELLHLAEVKESLTDIARDALAAELRKRGPSLRSSEQETQPLELGYGWGFAYALAFAGLASIQLFQSIAELSAATPSSLGAYQQGYYAGKAGLVFLVLLGSFAISRKHRSTLGIVYAFAALHAVGVLLRGVTPSDLAILLVIQFPSIRYFRRRKESFKRPAIREADSLDGFGLLLGWWFALQGAVGLFLSLQALVAPAAPKIDVFGYVFGGGIFLATGMGVLRKKKWGLLLVYVSLALAVVATINVLVTTQEGLVEIGTLSVVLAFITDYFYRRRHQFA